MKYSSVVFVCLLAMLASCKNKPLFTLLSPSQTGVHFNNAVTESDSLNPLNQVNIYNGGGVGIGDFNNDGLQDIYFTGNMVANKLYLNKGHMRFDDITALSNTSGAGKWCRGVAVVDINCDGWQDMYVSVSIDDDPEKRKNLLYINQKTNPQGIPVFKEMAREYGLDDTTHSTMALFFDYDNDADLDVYLVVNKHIPADNPSKFRSIITNGTHPSTGRLFRNDWSDSLKHGVYVNVSAQAGVTTEGYGHAGIITDINKDGWKDIYITNDFLSNNILYINNHDGTFTDRCKEYFKQTSTFAMGVDIQDLNNDGLQDVVELDMNPQDNYRKKMMLGSNSYQTMQNFDRYNYQYQYSKNSLQINQGNAVKQNDTISTPVFSQVSFLGGVSETDWSWTPLVTDFDDDGLRDIIITNGYPKDVTDHDFMSYRVKASLIATWSDILTQIPKVKLHNYAYQNKGDCVFKDITTEWGLTVQSFSNGAAYSDLDNDGDMDMIVNNINDPAFIYRNGSIHEGAGSTNYLNISFSGPAKNPGGYGAWVNIYYGNGKTQVYEHTTYRGYLSSVQGLAHFGLGNNTVVDSLVVVWPDLSKQVITNVKSGQLLNLNITDATLKHTFPKEIFAQQSLFREVTGFVGVDHVDEEKDFVDFNIQKLLPHKFSAYSPALAAADVDGNGLDDIFCGGNADFPTSVFYQQTNGRFIKKLLFKAPDASANTLMENTTAGSAGMFKDEGILLFDADNDGDNDLYIANGGYAQKPGAATYQDRFYTNTGKGNFVKDTAAIPASFTSKFCVRAADYDRDGDLDLFIAGRVEPWNYPKPVSGILLRNDSKKDKIKFTDVTSGVAKSCINIGLVCDAVFTDFNNDGWPDLILAGEWMPVTFLKNNKGVFSNTSVASGINNLTGWWNTIAPGDFDNDGDIDYVLGNLGLNSFYKATEQYPVHITAKDFDGNGSYDAFPSVFLPVSHQDTTMKEFPSNQRDDVVKQMVSLRAKFQNYKQYAFATMDSMFTPQQMKDAQRLSANMFASVYLSNNGNGKFTFSPLPQQAQVSVLNGMVVDDFNGDGNLDIVINGNDYGTDVSVGRYDALNGLLMTGNGKGTFNPQSILQSGIYIPGDGKALVQLKNNAGKVLLAASQHNGPLKIFELKATIRLLPVRQSDVQATLNYKNGKTQRREFYYGYSFLSQSARWLAVNNEVSSVIFTDSKGVERTISLN